MDDKKEIKEIIEQAKQSLYYKEAKDGLMVM